jgi:hypothetical protein
MPGQRRLPYARQVQEGKLTRLWTRASASLPLGWRLEGVMTRDVASQWAPTETAVGEDGWVALALETGGSGSAVGSGTSPEQALANLAEELRRMRGDPNG